MRSSVFYLYLLVVLLSMLDEIYYGNAKSSNSNVRYLVRIPVLFSIPAKNTYRIDASVDQLDDYFLFQQVNEFW